MTEIDLLSEYPKTKRPIEERGKRKLANDGYINLERDNMTNTDIYFENVLIQKAKNYEFEYFDGDRLYGYGGYYYASKYWEKTAHKIVNHYKLDNYSRILELGCAKGYLLYEIKKIIPQAKLIGLDISGYACAHAKEEVKDCIMLHDIRNKLPFNENSFDLVLAINVLSELELESCLDAINEISRVNNGASFITLNAWKNDLQKENLLKWNLTASSNYHIDDWKQKLNDIQYTGDLFWFFAE